MKDYDLRIFSDSLEIVNDTFMYAFFQIPYSFNGSFNLFVITSKIVSLTNALFIKTQTIVPEITHINPDTISQGTYFTFRIYGKNTHFLNCTYFRVWLVSFYADSISAINDTVVEVYSYIPFSVNPGVYNLKIENSIDGVMNKNGVIHVLSSNNAPKLTSISPDSSEQGVGVKTLIISRNTYFTTSGVQHITLIQGNYKIYRTSFLVINDTALYADFLPVLTAPTGYYDLEVKSNYDDKLLLPKCFTILPTQKHPEIISITPDSAYQNDFLTVNIIGSNTNFSFLGMNPGASLRKGADYISFSSVTAVNDTLIHGKLTIPPTAPIGLYNVNVYDSMDGKMILEKAFKVVEKPNLPQVLLTLPDTLIRGEEYMMRIFCRNINFSYAGFLFFRYYFDNDHFQPEVITVIEDSILMGKVKAIEEDASGRYRLVVRSDDNIFSFESALSVINSTQCPQIKEVTPNRFVVGNDYTIKIIGKNTRFTKAAYQSVRLIYYHTSILNAKSFSVINDTIIEAVFNMPLNLVLGWGKIEVRDSGDMELTYPVEILLPPHYPVITSVTPNFCKIGEKSTITIHSKNSLLTQNSEYHLVLLVRNLSKDTIYATNYQVINDTTATFDVHPSASLLPGDFDILLWNCTPSSMRSFKGLKLTRFSGYAKIQTAMPDSAFTNEKAEITLSCTGTKFAKDEIIFPVFTSPSRKYIYADSVIVINDTILRVLISIPADAEKGIWDISILTDQEGDFHLKGKFFIDSKVSIRETPESDILIFPNPFSEWIELQSSKPFKRIEISDLTGKTLFVGENILKNRFSINTQHLNTGIYLIKVVTDDHVILRKVFRH